VRCLLLLCQNGDNALGRAAYNGKLAMVEFLLGRGFDLEAKNNVRLHFSYISVSSYSAHQLLAYKGL
jgi:ankyrin repeat protein